jgi:hypothetical protein
MTSRRLPTRRAGRSPERLFVDPLGLVGRTLAVDETLEPAKVSGLKRVDLGQLLDLCAELENLRVEAFALFVCARASDAQHAAHERLRHRRHRVRVA